MGGILKYKILGCVMKLEEYIIGMKVLKKNYTYINRAEALATSKIANTYVECDELFVINFNIIV